ncbi:hypothetical protein OG711_07480 [Streptomyces uncialis]|uniref:hypothetical protein n=2 Tax=Streptomyces uncialis TaxID=1048205 RepID=UPI002E3649AF|nr:hypothetical protein [Streptomyces uncialis]
MSTPGTAPADRVPPAHRIDLVPRRSAAASSRLALGALIRRDLTVLRKNFGEFAGRTLMQPFLLVFVFLYVFPVIGQGVGSAGGRAGESAFATALVPGVVSIAIMFQGIQSVRVARADAAQMRESCHAVVVCPRAPFTNTAHSDVRMAGLTANPPVIAAMGKQLTGYTGPVVVVTTPWTP